MGNVRHAMCIKYGAQLVRHTQQCRQEIVELTTIGLHCIALERIGTHQVWTASTISYVVIAAALIVVVFGVLVRDVYKLCDKHRRPNNDRRARWYQ
jgi:nitrogen fixation/metabolism regulation signal transduction histidine kinase